MGAGSELLFQPQHRELPALAEFVATLKDTHNFHPDLDTLLEPLLNLISSAQTAAILLWDINKGMLIPVASNYPNSSAYLTLKFEPGEGPPGIVLIDSQAHLFDDPDAISSLYNNLQSNTSAGIKLALGKDQLPQSVMVVPLQSSQKVWGVLQFEIYQGQEVFDNLSITKAKLAADLIAFRFDPPILFDQRKDDHAQLSTSTELEQNQIELLNTLEHELRLPLTAIKGFATALLLEEVEWSPEKRQEFLQLIADECDHMETLIGNYLNSAVMELDQIPIDSQSVSLAHIADQVALEMKSRTELHRLLVEFSADFPIIQADPHWIKQVFRNLLDNAIKYSPDGGLVVVRGEVRSKDVVVSISDQGIGISPEDLIPLFEKYRRAKNPQNHQIPGSGLGLSITRMIIETHGGRMWAQSVIGEGTTISFSLPHNQQIEPEGDI